MTINEQTLCITYPEVSRNVYFVTLYENFITSSEQFTKVVNDDQPFPSCFSKKRNQSPIYDFPHTQSTVCQNFRFVFTNGKKVSVDDMFRGSSTKEELELHHLRHKQVHPQNFFATLTDDNQINRMQYPVEYEIEERLLSTLS